MMNVFSVVGLIITIASLILAFYSLLNAKKKLHFIWGVFSFSVAIWGFGIFKFSSTLNIESSVFWWRIAEIGVIFIPVLLVHFVLEFLGKPKPIFIKLFYLISSAFLFFNLFTNKFFGELRMFNDDFYYITPTKLYSLFISIFIASALYSVFLLYRKYEENNRLINKRIKYLIVAFSVGFIGGATSFLPVYGINVYPLFNITILISALLVVYSMFEHKLLDIKVITTQLLIFSMWFFLFGRIMLSTDLKSRIIDSILLATLIFFGTLLVKSITKEIKAREEIEKLAQDLKEANTQLKRLDKQKSEFVSIASHQLRAPITSLKGYSSMILEGSYGPVSTGVMEVVGRLFQSSQSLALIIDDFLNLSRIERGKIEFTFDEANIRELVEQAINEIKPRFEEKKINLTTEITEKNYISNIDGEKIRQVVLNLLDNSLKYTKEGSVDLKLSKIKEGKILLMIRDTGIGMAKEEIPHLFTKFKRLDNANDANIKGTGLGLYLAKTIIEAHKGKIWAESEGEGKGSSFFVELNGV